MSEGYTATTVRGLAKEAGVDINAMIRVMGNKENILCHLVEYVLEGQFEATRQFMGDKTDDPVLYYAAETVLQLYMAESSEQIRDLYTAAYSMPESSALIMRNITGKLEKLFGAYQPTLETKDFFEFEIATGSIMRGFMTIPCDMYFTMDRKVRRFIECVFRIFQVPEAKVEEAIAFVSQFDYPMLARQVVDGMIRKLSESDDI
ncbi:MAG: TetR/AcrR family transcriptional regulator [Clostridia bacterium]|nr:TetR/AcrR family transcriptional regulator [Clostridia bacterium]